MKKCSKCGEVKEMSEFYECAACKNGRQPACKSCYKKQAKIHYQKNKERILARCKKYKQENAEAIVARNKKYRQSHPTKVHASYHASYQLMRAYGITLEQKQEMIRKQNGKCAICNKKFDMGNHANVDHDHATGKVRGILCRDCNLMLGLASDDISILESAIAYLRYFTTGA